MPRFIFLEHVGAPDDPVGRHVDLLLEDGDSCRTWRLASIPAAGGDAVEATPIAPHRLAWLDHVDGPVSGNRGHARRIAAGTYTGLDRVVDNGREKGPRAAADAVLVRLAGEGLMSGTLTITAGQAWLELEPSGFSSP